MQNVALLSAPGQVIRCLVRYTDWWHPSSSSVIQVAGARRASGFADGIPEGVLDSLDEHTEICRRMLFLEERDRELLFLWYVKQLEVGEISKALHMSRRQCFRRRAGAIRKLVELGEEAPAA